LIRISRKIRTPSPNTNRIDLDRLAAQVEFFLADATGRQLLAPFEVGLGQVQRCFPAVERGHGGAEVGDLVIDILDRMLELESIGPGLGHQAAHLGLGRRQVRFGRRHSRLLDRDLDLVRLLVKPDQHVPLFHTHIVINQHLAHLARHPGCHEGHMAVDVSVIGGNRVQHRIHGRNQEVSADRQADHGPGQQHPFSPAVRGWLLRWFDRCAGRRAGGRGDLLAGRSSLICWCGRRLMLRFRLHRLGRGWPRFC